ncbi:polymorphic toxin type 50 domain-containing protein [Nocardioides limicola]|uniref:polymorphic toxin type 50 domain-containing protein n=1 Tax=Nocardioides limicola TaxID=2803368 RepID=UPI00193AEA50|nr:polymorphic toxin type 50 domain-containing protein [Nocardioides sp. DJM-14]
MARPDLLMCALASVLFALIGWLCVANPAQASSAPTPGIQIYSYDSQHLPSLAAVTATERGPPSTHDCATNCNAADRWSGGASAWLDATTPRATFDYDRHALLAQVAHALGTTREPARALVGDLPLLTPAGVAANGVPPRFITTGAGTTIDRLAINSSISAQRQGRHVLGARQYKGGSYFNSADDAQSVLDDFHSGAAQVLGVKGNDIVVRAPNVTGFNHNPGAGFPNQATNVFFIKGSSSPSVIPDSPGWTP